jgi:hypothetical protein
MLELDLVILQAQISCNCDATVVLLNTLTIRSTVLENAVVDHVLKQPLTRLWKPTVYFSVHTTLDPALRHCSPVDI